MRKPLVSCLVWVLVLTGVARAQEIVRVLAVAGSTPGAFGSFFRTGLQLTNLSGGSTSVQVVYHPSGLSGSASDPSLSVSIPPNATVSYDDIVQSLGQSGLGSIDLKLTSVSTGIVTRIFNDAGAAGTSGFTEQAVDIDHAYLGGPPFNVNVGVLISPSDPARFRFNIGVRALAQGATLRFLVRDSGGTLVTDVTKTYAPTYFEQKAADVLLGIPLSANDSIQIHCGSGSAIVYGATTDNITNDPSFQPACALLMPNCPGLLTAVGI